MPFHKSARFGSVLLMTLGLFLLLCLLTYDPSDIPLLSSSPKRPAANLGGTIGSWIGFTVRGGFGWASLLAPLVCFLWAARLWQGELRETHPVPFGLSAVCLLAGVGTMLALQTGDDASQTALGGIVGFLFADAGRYYLGTAGTALAAGCAALLSWLVVAGQPLSGLDLGRAGAWIGRLPGFARARRETPGRILAHPRAADQRGARTGRTLEPAPASPRINLGPVAEPAVRPAAPAEDRPGADAGTAAASMQGRVRSTVEPKTKSVPTPPRRHARGGFQYPPLDLLVTPPPISERQITEDLQASARILEETLLEFGVEAKVVNIDRGPTVTRYELTPAPGVKLTKIVALADELALVMKAASCHVVAPIPGKGRVGIDVPNTITTTVYLKEIITAHEFASHTSPLALPIGKDVSGRPVVVDLRDCPHLLIAGATGSGKTVSLNSLLIGILSHVSPEQVKLLLVDPKMVEMAMFNDIPHLACPVVTGAKKASVALHWAVQEMDRRYQLLAKLGARNIDAYNRRIAAEPPAADMPSGENGDDGPEPDGPLPYLVIVIDELADLMMVAAQDVEGAITRLAQLSRAVGLHMILATQRPSVDVITGVIKANFPARVAFQVASKVDSRTILDMNGADKLLGRGDLLFLQPGNAKPIRAQGALVTDAEIERITSFLKQQGAPVYDERLMEHQRQPEAVLGGDRDELYEMAKQLVLDVGQASTSLLQRRLRLGYGRAARMLDMMEQEGLVGPPQGSRPREVLASRQHAAGQGE